MSEHAFSPGIRLFTECSKLAWPGSVTSNLIIFLDIFPIAHPETCFFALLLKTKNEIPGMVPSLVWRELVSSLRILVGIISIFGSYLLPVFGVDSRVQDLDKYVYIVCILYVIVINDYNTVQVKCLRYHFNLESQSLKFSLNCAYCTWKLSCIQQDIDFLISCVWFSDILICRSKLLEEWTGTLSFANLNVFLSSLNLIVLFLLTSTL